MVEQEGESGSEPGPEAGSEQTAPPSDDGAAVSPAESDAVTVELPPDVAAFLDDRVSDDPDRDRAAFLRDLAIAHRSLVDGDEPTATELADRLDAQRAEYVELVEDVRERVVEVARDAGGPDDELASRLDEVETELQRLRERVDGGFENYETVLTEVTEAVDDLGNRTDTLASTVVSLREEALAGDAADGPDDLTHLRETANRRGVGAGDCDNCGNRVDVSLLTAAECPHCEYRLVDVRDDGGFFGSPTIVTADPPALDGDGTNDGDSE